MNIEIDHHAKARVSETRNAGYEESLLWKSFKKGNRLAFGQIFDIYHKPLTSYGQKIYPDQDFINDCIQEMFLEFWQYRETVGDVVSLEFYIIKCFKRKILRNKERLSKKLTERLEDNYDKIITNSFEADLVSEQAEQQKRNFITHEIKELSKRQQEAIFLKFYEDLTYGEICVIMSLNYQSVKNLIHNSIKTLRENLELRSIFN